MRHSASSGSPCFFWRGASPPPGTAGEPAGGVGACAERSLWPRARGLASRGAPWAPTRACCHNYLTSRESSVWQAVKVTTHERQHEVPAPVPAMMLPIVRCICLASCILRAAPVPLMYHRRAFAVRIQHVAFAVKHECTVRSAPDTKHHPSRMLPRRQRCAVESVASHRRQPLVPHGAAHWGGRCQHPGAQWRD